MWQALKNETSINGAQFRGENDNLSSSADVLPKGARKRGNIVAETSFPEMFHRRANKETFAEEANVSEQIQKRFLLPGKQILLPQQKFPGGANGETLASATMFRQHRFFVCGRLKKRQNCSFHVVVLLTMAKKRKICDVLVAFAAVVAKALCCAVSLQDALWSVRTEVRLIKRHVPALVMESGKASTVPVEYTLNYEEARRGPLTFSLGRFQPTSKDTNNNREMYDFRWTN